MSLSSAQQAAFNNAAWCDALCRAHGASGEFQACAWLNRRPAPRFYPNLVTLTPRRPAAQLALIEELAAARLPPGWAVKDSFGELELAALGFRLLFTASWLWRAPARAAPLPMRPGLAWRWLQGGAELAQWEAAWGASPLNAAPVQAARLFPPALLADPQTAFLAAYQDGALTAGAIASLGGGAAGLSNLFAPPAQRAFFWAGLAALASERFPGRPLVGYEQGADLALAQAAGFAMIQDLRVWVFEP